MRIRVVNKNVARHFGGLRAGVHVLGVGNLVHHVQVDDGLMVYSSDDDCTSCQFSHLALILEVSVQEEYLVLDVRSADFTIVPDARGRQFWRKKPFLVPNIEKAEKYRFREYFADLFQRQDLRTVKLEDAVGEVYKHDLSVPTLVPEEGWIYLFDRKDALKIGRTVDLFTRQRDLEREQGQKLELVHSFKSRDYVRAEALLHQRFREVRRGRSEWFDLGTEQVAYICSISDFGLDE